MFIVMKNYNFVVYYVFGYEKEIRCDYAECDKLLGYVRDEKSLE